MNHPIEDRPTPDIDWTCQRIAEYLRDGLNAAYVPDKIYGLERRQAIHLQQVAQGIEAESSYFTDQIAFLDSLPQTELPRAVNSVRAYDSFNVGNHEFPLLKVYRTQDIYKPNQLVRNSPVVAAYCLVLPDQEELQGSLSWVSKTMAKLLLQSQSKFCTIIEGQPRAEYRTMLNEMVQPVYTFLRFYFTIKD
jgi:hypothetical protein